MIRPFLIALQFLTRIPLQLDPPPQAGETGRSLLYYPLVGLVIGFLLWLSAHLLAGQGHLLAAALLCLVWVLITGGLHLDGMADTVDGWLGGLRDRERTLAIMQDPATGPMGTLSLILVLLLKFAALYTLLEDSRYAVLLLPPVLGRTAGLVLLATTPYVRARGLAELLTREADSWYCLRISALAAAAVFMLAPLAGALAIVLSTALLLGWRRLLLQRLGGFTGDTTGALIEGVEVSTLVLLALVY